MTRPLRSRNVALPVCLAGLAAAALACSAAPPPETKPTAAAPTTAVAVSEAPDLSPVPAPQGLVARARLKNLTVGTHLAARVAGAPADKVDGLAQRGLAELIVGRKGMRLDVDAERLASELVLDAPVDVVVVLGDADRPDPKIAFAVGLRSLDGVRAAAGDAIADAGPQGFTIGGKRARGTCVASVASGPIPARLVCGTKEEDVLALRPYLTRTLTVEPPPASDLFAQVDVAAIDAKFGGTVRRILPSVPTLVTRQIGIGEPTFDKALEDGVRFLANEGALALGDLDKVTVEGRLAETGALSLDFTSSLRGKQSWFVKTALATPSAPLPPLFWRGPSDAASGGFVSVGDPAAYSDVAKTLRGLVQGALSAGKIGTDAERKKIAALVDLPVQPGAIGAVYAGDGSIGKPAAPKTPKEKLQAALAATSGWTMIATNQKSDAIAKWMTDAGVALGQPGVQAAIKKESGGDLVLTMKPGKAPAKAGTGAKAFDLTISTKEKRDKKELKKDLVYTFVVAPDGDGAWIAGGFDAAELGERIAAVKAGQSSLSGRADLAPLKQGSYSSAGFLSARSLRSSAMGFLMFRMPAQQGGNQDESDLMLDASKKADALFDGLPAKGRSPIFFRTSATATQASFGIEIPKATFEEITAAVKILR